MFIDRFLRFLANTPSIESLIALEQNNPDRFEKIRKAHNEVLLKSINKQLKKSLILYFHPYTTQCIVMVDWTGERPLQIGQQEFTMSRMPIDIETGRMLKAGKIIFHSPVFLHNYFTELFALVNREDGYGVRIHGRPYQHPSGRIISGPSSFVQLHPMFYFEPPRIGEGLAAMHQYVELSMQNLLIDTGMTQEYSNLVRNRVACMEDIMRGIVERQEQVEGNGYPLPPDYRESISVRERIPEQIKEEEPREEVEDLLEKIDTLLEGEDPENDEENYIPRVAQSL